MCYGHIVYKKIEDFFHKFGSCYTFKGWHLKSKLLETLKYIIDFIIAYYA